MKFIYYIMVFILFAVPSFGVEKKCSKQCVVDVDSKTQQPTGDLSCTLPNMNTFPITAPNVLNTDGTLKTYFETKNTVCDVLGWMNGAVPFIKKHYGGMNMQVGTPLRLFWCNA